MAREKIAAFAELVKSPPVYHTYQITPLSLWNAASLGYTADRIIASLQTLARWGTPAGLEEEINRLLSRYGKLTLHSIELESELIELRANTPELLDELEAQTGLREMGLRRIGQLESLCPAERRGQLKQELMRLGYPVLDYAGYHQGQELQVAWRDGCSSRRVDVELEGDSFGLRDYQQEAVQLFQGSEGHGGSGVVVLPCGAGKTIVGLAVLQSLQCETLILTSNTISVRQWMDELRKRTDLGEDAIGEYSGEKREDRKSTRLNSSHWE